jgi:copper resistance protein B
MPHEADRYWDAAEMARGRDIMMRHDGGARNFAQVMIDIAEVQVRDDRDGYRWEGEGWFGGDIDRFVVKSEGEGALGAGLDSAEVQALYSRAIGPYFNLQAGVRHDIRPTPDRTYVTLGVEGLAPYWFEIDAAAFLSTRGDLLGRIEGYYDQRITQRLILQPRAEFNLSAQDVAPIGLGSGLTSAEFGLRLRYEVRREFAPYIGVGWERTFGDTARFARAGGDRTGGFALVAGIRGWF